MHSVRSRLEIAFLVLSAVSLCGGSALGVVMGVSEDFSLGPVHAHANLLGWVSLALFGLFYRSYPEMAATRTARVHLALSGASAILFPVGLWLELTATDHIIMRAAAAAWVLGAASFLSVVVRLARQHRA